MKEKINGDFLSEHFVHGLKIVEGKGVEVSCTFCHRKRFYVPRQGTKLTDLRGKKVQCFFCGKSFPVV